jgi:hypothetical protein
MKKSQMRYIKAEGVWAAAIKGMKELASAGCVQRDEKIATLV